MKQPAYQKKVEIRHRRRKDEKERAVRLRRLIDKKEMALALCQEWDRRGEIAEARRCLRKIRLVEQQIRYINDGSEL